MNKKLQAVTLATASIAMVGVGAGVVAAAPSVHHSKGLYSACLTSENTLINVTLSPEPRVKCPNGTTRVTWNARGPRGKHGVRGSNGARGPAGAPGTPGANGSTVLNGTGAPDASVGQPGDFYIDTQAWKIYGPKTADGWPTTGQSLQGPSGGSGAAGRDGTSEVTVVRGSGEGTTLPYDFGYEDVVAYDLPGGHKYVVHAKVVISETDQGQYSSEGSLPIADPLSVECQLGRPQGVTDANPDEAFANIAGNPDTGQAATTLSLTNDYDLSQASANQTYTVKLSCENTNQGNTDDEFASEAVLDITTVDTLHDDSPGEVYNPNNNL